MNRTKYSKTHIKILGVFRMETENFSPEETRKTLKCAALWLMAVLAVWKLFVLAELLLR